MRNSRLLAYGSSWHLSSLSALYFAQGLPAGFLGLGLTTFLTVKVLRNGTKQMFAKKVHYSANSALIELQNAPLTYYL